MNYKLLAGMFLLSASMVSNAALSGDLIKERQAVIQEYIDDLAHGDAENIKKLFEQNGVVISTSQGKVNAYQFFDSFLPLIQQANTQIHARYISGSDNNRLVARFHFDYILIDGEQGGGEYVDEFVFLDNSSKLLAVYMFENLKFPDQYI